MVSSSSMASFRLRHTSQLTRRYQAQKILKNSNIQCLGGMNAEKISNSRNFSSDDKFQRYVGNGGSKAQSNSFTKMSSTSFINSDKLYGVEFQSQKVSYERHHEAGYFNSDSGAQSSRTTSTDLPQRSKETPRNQKQPNIFRKKPKRLTLIKYQDVESSIYNHFYYHYYHSKNNPVYRENMPFKTKIPVLDASPLFDPALFCRKSALKSGDASISGTAAAKRLRQGKQLAVDLLQHDLCNWGPSSKVVYYDDDVEEDTFLETNSHQNNKNEREHNSENEDETKTLKVQSPPWTKEGGVSLLQASQSEVNHFDSSIKSSKWRKRKSAKKYEQKKSRAFVLEGHGVPFQLFQDHIDLCDTLLSKHEGALECTFNNFDGKLTVDW